MSQSRPPPGSCCAATAVAAAHTHPVPPHLRLVPVSLVTVSLLLAVATPRWWLSAPRMALAAEGKEGNEQRNVALGSVRPLVAIWCIKQGRLSPGPHLRIAIWDDGRVLFAADPRNPTKWSHQLREGKVPAERLAELKKQITRTGVFDLKETSYLVPDADFGFMRVNFGTRQQMLGWDEVESLGYGIDSAPESHQVRFKQCWQAVNRLALACRPADAKPVKGRFGHVPPSWYLFSAQFR